MSTFYEQAAAFRKALLLHALAATGERRYRAARLLGVQPTYLYRLLKQHGIETRKSTGVRLVPGPRVASRMERVASGEHQTQEGV